LKASTQLAAQHKRVSMNININDHGNGVTIQITGDNIRVEYEFADLGEALEALPNLDELNN